MVSNRNEQLVVVLTRSYSTGVGVIRALGVAGFTVEMVASVPKKGKSKLASQSKYLRKSVEIVSDKFRSENETDEALLNALLEYKGKTTGRKPVLFPTDDYTTSIMDSNRSKLDEIFLMPQISGGEEGAMVKAMDKMFQGELARKAGILTPLEWIIPLNQTIQIPDEMVYPCFVKPIESITGYKKEMAVCKNRGELVRHLAKLQKNLANRSVLVQEYLKIDNEIDVSGVCLDQEIIIPAIIRKTCVAKFEKGVTLSGKLVPYEELGEQGEKIKTMLKEFHYIGMFDMEFNVVGDKMYFNEVNLRSGGPNFSYFRSGANLPAIFVDEICGQRHSEADEKLDVYGKNFIYEKVAWDDYMNRRMPKQELRDRFDASDFGLLEYKEDPGPYNCFMKEIRIRKIKRTFRKVKKWNKKQKNKINEFISNSRIIQKMKNRIQKLKNRILGVPQEKYVNRRNPYVDRPRVLVAGRNYSSNLSIARSLGEAGYSVEVLRIYQTRPKTLLKKMKPDRYSKYIKAYYVFVSGRNDNSICNKLVRLADRKNKMLLIPSDDLVAAVSDKYYNRLKKYYLLQNVADTQGEINRIMEKGVQKELARKAGLPVLNSCVVQSRNGYFRIPDSVEYPCFIKPDVSRNGAKSRMKKCENEEQLNGWLTLFSQKRDISMLVEDYVEIVNEYSILGVSTKDGAIGPAAFVALHGGKDEHRGVALTGEILPLEALQPLADKLINFVSGLDFEGLYDIDLVETKDGTIYFVEINMRLGASGYAFTKCGVNLPGIFADYMIYHKPLDFNLKVSTIGKHFVSEKVLLDEYAGNRISKKDVREIMRQSDLYFIKSEDDPKAYRYFKMFFNVAALQRKKQKQPVTTNNLDVNEMLVTVREKMIASVMRKTRMNYNQAVSAMEDVKNRFGISYSEYNYRNLWRIKPENLAEYLEEQENFRLQREENVKSVMKKAGWGHDQADFAMDRVKKTFNITYREYDFRNLWKVPEKSLRKYFQSIESTGCTDDEYHRYKFNTLSAKVQKNVFLISDSNKLRERYKVDERLKYILDHRDLANQYFDEYLHRSWCINKNISEKEFMELFLESGKLVYIPDGSGKSGIKVFEINHGNASQVFSKITALPKGVIEEYVIQHADMDAITSTAVNKIRIVTVSSNDEFVTQDGKYCDVAYATLRMGDENPVDNHILNGGLSAGIDLESGIVITSAVDKNCDEFVEHPVTGIEIRGLKVPMFEEAISMVLTAIEKNKLQGYLGWDIAITEKGPELIEVHDQPAAVFLTAPYIPEKMGMKHVMEKYL